ncbi:Myb-like DNA-binding domain [Teratosphaeria destructans]|uniref:Myb-like DNA-binding domain n=1 Tax=Teratosphaeria destructans TaxID=418781 RepID=A0A9W7T0D2_9PEZI|nr:Myb-like DNA-binding domain [Teratosphaeria destructans]
MPQHKRGPWSQTEDQYLLHLVSLHGAHNWVRISATMQTRSPKQCRERFHQNLKPNLNHDPITPEEGVLIEQMVAEMGKRWAEIARRLRGRSDNAVKNWWNGGMNRRRRSNNPRRVDLESRQQQAANSAGQSLPPPTHHHSLPSNIHQHAPPPQPPQFFGQPIYPVQHFPQQISVPSNVGPMYHRHSSLIETPLPSPSAFSQFSADGAPSLISDNSSLSGRSPHHGPSPIELPPLGGAAPGSRDDRRPSGPMHRLSVPGVIPLEGDYHMPSGMTMKHDQPSLQPPFMPHQHQQFQQFAPPQHFLPSQTRPMMAHMQPPPFHPQHQMAPSVLVRSQQPATPAPLQLPSISNLAVSSGNMQAAPAGYHIDPALGGSAMQSVASPEGSPKDKMSLSNLTH